jgi:uncharacterized protein (TIGR01777 family)
MTNPSRILVSGASGLIGNVLIGECATRQISVTRLVRKQPAAADEILWSPLSEDAVADAARLEGFDAVIHLSGANIAAHRWTAAYKQEIVESRANTTQTLARLLAGLRNPPRMLLCASATGIYGNRGDEVLTEESEPGSGFLAETCIAWEAAAQPARDAGIGVAHLRFGVVLIAGGGALGKMVHISRLGLGGRLASGKQWISWISLADAVRAVFHIIDTPLFGPVNMVGPIPVTNADFTRTLAHAVHRPAIFPVPAVAMRLAFGEMAEMVLASTRAIPAKLAQSGFRFEHAELAFALESLLAKSA